MVAGIDISDREKEFQCKTVLIRKVTNFIEKNACRLVYFVIYNLNFLLYSYYIDPESTLVCQSGRPK